MCQVVDARWLMCQVVDARWWMPVALNFEALGSNPSTELMTYVFSATCYPRGIQFRDFVIVPKYLKYSTLLVYLGRFVQPQNSYLATTCAC